MPHHRPVRSSINIIVICPVCGLQMDSMGAWPTYPDNYLRQYQSTFVCAHDLTVANPPPTMKTLTVGWLYRPDAPPPAKGALDGR